MADLFQAIVADAAISGVLITEVMGKITASAFDAEAEIPEGAALHKNARRDAWLPPGWRIARRLLDFSGFLNKQPVRARGAPDWRKVRAK